MVYDWWLEPTEKEDADQMVVKIKKEFGWVVYVKEA